VTDARRHGGWEDTQYTYIIIDIYTMCRRTNLGPNLLQVGRDGDANRHAALGEEGGGAACVCAGGGD
jgi:hypothetical protein